MIKTYKFRLYPNNIQKEQINKTFGCVRFVYNNILSYRKEMYEKENKSLSKLDCNNYCNHVLKDKFIWLKEVDKFALTNSIYNMDNAYNNFFLKKTLVIQNLKVNIITIKHIRLTIRMVILT